MQLCYDLRKDAAFMGLRYFETVGSDFLPFCSRYLHIIDKPVKNYQVGQNGYNDKAKVGLPSNGSNRHQEKSLYQAREIR